MAIPKRGRARSFAAERMPEATTSVRRNIDRLFTLVSELFNIKVNGDLNGIFTNGTASISFKDGLATKITSGEYSDVGTAGFGESYAVGRVITTSPGNNYYVGIAAGSDGNGNVFNTVKTITNFDKVIVNVVYY